MVSTQLAAIAIYAAIVLVAIYTDVRFRRLPNWLCAVNLVAGLGYMAMSSGDWRLVGLAAVHAAVSLAFGFALSVAGVFGAGDAKFYASTAAWFVIMDFLRMLVSVSLVGLVLLAVFVGWRRLVANDPRGFQEDDFAKLPYGVAIGVGGLMAMVSL